MLSLASGPTALQFGPSSHRPPSRAAQLGSNEGQGGGNNSLEDPAGTSSTSGAAAGGLLGGPLRGASPPTIRLSHSSSQSSHSVEHLNQGIRLVTTASVKERFATNTPQYVFLTILHVVYFGFSGGSSSGLTVAKKKRELFSARSSRSGGSAQSSLSVASELGGAKEGHSPLYKRLESSSGSSGRSIRCVH